MIALILIIKGSEGEKQPVSIIIIPFLCGQTDLESRQQIKVG